MGYLDPKHENDDPESPGLGLDLETRVCPECGEEALPWHAECEACGVPTVHLRDIPAPRFELPGLELDGYEGLTDEADGEGAADDGRG